MVGGGRRGLGLASDLVAEGHAVRFVTRDEARRDEIENAGCECWIGDPDRIGTLRNGLENVTILMWLMGTATGPDPERLAALHGTRLRMMLEKTIDSTVRGVVYENAGTVGEEMLASGVAEVLHAHDMNEIPYELIEVDPSERVAWREAAHAAIETLLAPRPAATAG
jgi:hypothetical protein